MGQKGKTHVIHTHKHTYTHLFVGRGAEPGLGEEGDGGADGGQLWGRQVSRARGGRGGVERALLRVGRGGVGWGRVEWSREGWGGPGGESGVGRGGVENGRGGADQGGVGVGSARGATPTERRPGTKNQVNGCGWEGCRAERASRTRQLWAGSRVGWERAMWEKEEGESGGRRQHMSAGGAGLGRDSSDSQSLSCVCVLVPHAPHSS